jgi:ABC-type Fe3+/spermidine/putrescine transport system ATPase subunit
MALKVVNLSKRYRDKWVLRDVSFEVAEGEVLGIFGTSGSGKSTLLNLILGSTSANGGSIRTRDIDVTTLGSDARGFRSVSLGRGWFWQRLAGKNRVMSDTARRLGRLKVAIGKASNLLVLDDPLCGMDSGTVAKATALLKSSAQARRFSVVYASSDFERLLEFCDRIAVLSGGEIKQIGTPQEVYEKPASRAVAAITGRNNLFAARRLTSSKAEIPEFHTIDGEHRLFAQRISGGALGALNQNVTLGIRPEYISISFGASFPEDNLLKARVENIQFLGATTLVGLNAGGLKLNALVLRVVGLNIGDECMVGMPPDRIQIFRD